MIRSLLPLLVALGFVACDASTATPATPSETVDESSPVAAVGEQASPAPAPRSDVGSKSGGPYLTTPEREHAFGRVTDVKKLRYTFSFTNTGDEDLVIDKVKTSCSCTVAKLSKDRYAPGEGDTVEVSWKPKGRGIQAQTVDILSNAKNAAFLRFRVTADVEPKLKIDPLNVDFGTVELRTEKTETVRLVTTDETVEVIGVSAINDVYRVLFRPVGQDGHLGNVDITLKDTAAAGAANGSLQIDYRFLDPETNQLSQERATVNLRAKVFGTLSLDPTAFFVGRVDPGGEVSNAVRITHRDKRPFQVTARLLRSTPDSLEVVTREISPGVVEVTVQGPMGDYLDRISGMVQIVTDVPGEDLFELGVMGIVRAEEK